MINSAMFQQACVDSDLEVVGTSIYESYAREPVAVFFVPASEERGTLAAPMAAWEDPSECRCCCCTGECRPDYDDVEYDTSEQDAQAIARYDEAVATGTLPEGFSSLEDFGYVGGAL